MLKHFILFVMGAILTSSAQNGKIPGQSEFEMAEDLFQAKKYTAWLSILEMAVAKQHPAATVRKGDAYYNGFGVEKNYEEALIWYKKGAELHNTNALLLVGKLYKDSLIAGKTCADAVAYYVALSDKEIHAATTLVGAAYLNGEGVPKNVDTAKAWFEKGMAVSEPGCIYYMGIVHKNGMGVPANIAKGLELMQQACDLNYLAACETLGEIYYKGEGVEANAEESVKWYTKGTKLKGAKSHFYYSNYILLGYIDGKKADALSYARKAKKLGYDPVACDFLVIKINGEMQE